MKQGFTLVELLVVVLIIGILSSVALPQYTKAVEKSRISEVLTRTSSLEKVMDLYVLENGYKNVSFFGKNAVNTDIDVTIGLQQNSVGTDNMDSKYFDYQGYCDDSRCYWTVARLSPGGIYVLWAERLEGGVWTHYCEFDEDDSVAKTMCNQLFSQGWQQGDLFF